MTRENARVLLYSALYGAATAVGCSIGTGENVIILFVLFFFMFLVAHLLGFPWTKRRTAEASKTAREDDNLYWLAAREVADHRFVPALMAKAYSFALGDEAKTKALYIALRVDQMRSEVQEAGAREETERALRERAGRAVEKQKGSELIAEQRRREDAEAQRVGDAWNRRESIRDGWGPPAEPGTKRSEDVQKPRTPPPGPPLSPEELDKIIESLKKSL